jgi:hypothetical protein
MQPEKSRVASPLKNRKRKKDRSGCGQKPLILVRAVFGLCQQEALNPQGVKCVLAETASLHGLSAEEIADERHVDVYRVLCEPAVFAQIVLVSAQVTIGAWADLAQRRALEAATGVQMSQEKADCRAF